ncbi:AAA family ATPase [Okeanomitos corallinicola TIOX110]|uniref:AAA family ATPase n=1 Tax=Okeanomitos corallinicola TIOX110 TaxID=3133117 RepID=A0ABZ2URE4_9CYAN
MKLLRIRVPDFRILKDVDIQFDKNFSPNIFPLGSQNGGGKSTLLQLIFILLHCCTNPERKVFIKNLLQGFVVNDDSSERELATINIWDDEKEVELRFLVCKNNYIEKQQDNGYKDNDDLGLSNFQEIENIINKIYKTEQDIEQIEKAINKLEIDQKIASDSIKDKRLMEVMSDLISADIIKPRKFSTIEELKQRLENILEIYKINLDEFYKNIAKLKVVIQKLSGLLSDKNLLYICNYSSGLSKDEDEVLLCQINNNLDIKQAKQWLRKLEQKIFLAAPISQVFLFTSQTSRRLLFEQNSHRDYDLDLQNSKSKLPGLFTYDFFPVDLLIKAFTTARDEDFRDAIDTEGHYGNRYKNLLNELNLILVNKKVTIAKDFSKVKFKLDKGDSSIEIYPEDLSHGELKRLSIYMWIKYNKIEDAIVLMDEIEIALHPDWQYQIIADLEQWSPNNQYILATHSYELCQALTPAHVRELEPKLIKSNNQ